MRCDMHLKVILAFSLVMSLAAFIMMGVDKSKAKKGKWRIPENTLFLPVILGGGLGGILGMYVFRHKTKHWYFRFGFPVIFVLEAALLVWLVISLKFI